MAIADDISVAVNGDIRYTGTTANYTVLELHRFLQDLADNASSSGDDLLDITDTNPSSRSTDNIITLNSPYNIDDTLSEHLYDGSITQSGGDTVYSGLIVVGSLASTTTLKIVQNNTFYDSQSAPFWGTGLNIDSANNILLRVLVKTRDSGADIDGKRIRVQARELGDTYAEFSLTMGLGNSTAAIFTNTDLNNQTAAGTIATWSTISNTEGYQTIDLNNGNGAQPYYSQWNIGSQSINDTYERAKWITRGQTSETIHGMNGELFRGITHEWDYDMLSGSFIEDELLSWGTGATAGTGILLADNTTDTMWVQLLTGVAPTDNTQISGGTSSETCMVNGVVTTHSISPCFLGASTGTNIIGAFGIGFETADIGSSDQLFDLTNTQQVPPNNQTFTVSNLVSGEDQVLVAQNDGSDEVDYDQLSLNGTLSGAAVTSVVVATTIPSDTPSTGTIRVLNDIGRYVLCTYTSYTGSAFTINSTDFSTNNATTGNNVFISYIDEQASGTTATFTATYSSDRSLVVKVRNGSGTIEIVPFKTSATFGSAGGSVTTIRTADV